jgi:hypothetical protein
MRQLEGIDLAKKEGKYRGRVKKYHHKYARINYAVKLYPLEKCFYPLSPCTIVDDSSRSYLWNKSIFSVQAGI